MQESVFLFISFSFLFGLVVGSFLNVLIIRGGKRAFRGRSRCLACRKTLSWYELIPVASFFIQKGRCRSCGVVLLLQYLFVEVGTGAAYAVATWYIFKSDTISLENPFLVGSVFLFIFLAIAAAVVVFVSDIRWQVIPNGAVLTLLFVGIAAVAFRIFQKNSTSTMVVDFFWDVGAAGIVALLLAALWFFSRGLWMGFGDVKLVFALSLMAGFPTSVAALLFSFWVGGLWGGGLLLFKKGGLKSVMPFGPFLIVGTVLGYFFVDNILGFIIII